MFLEDFGSDSIACTLAHFQGAQYDETYFTQGQEWGKQPALNIKVVLHTKSAVSMCECEGRDRLCSMCVRCHGVCHIMCVSTCKHGPFIDEHVHSMRQKDQAQYQVSFLKFITTSPKRFSGLRRVDMAQSHTE